MHILAGLKTLSGIIATKGGQCDDDQYQHPVDTCRAVILAFVSISNTARETP